MRLELLYDFSVAGRSRRHASAAAVRCSGTVWYCVALLGYCMVLYGTVWYCVVLYGTVRVLYGTVWYCVALLGYCMVLYGTVW